MTDSENPGKPYFFQDPLKDFPDEFFAPLCSPRHSSNAEEDMLDSTRKYIFDSGFEETEEDQDPFYSGKPFTPRRSVIIDGDTITDEVREILGPNFYRTKQEFEDDVFGGYL
jgi:hypothetical protein